MKRMLIIAASVVAAAAFAAPANAQDIEDLLPATTKPVEISACYPGEKLDTCLIRILRDVPNDVFDLAAYALYVAGDAAGDTIDTVEAACERYLSGCAAVPTP